MSSLDRRTLTAWRTIELCLCGIVASGEGISGGGGGRPPLAPGGRRVRGNNAGELDGLSSSAMMAPACDRETKDRTDEPEHGHIPRRLVSNAFRRNLRSLIAWWSSGRSGVWRGMLTEPCRTQRVSHPAWPERVPCLLCCFVQQITRHAMSVGRADLPRAISKHESLGEDSHFALNAETLSKLALEMVGKTLRALLVLCVCTI